jgi:hypothetical protein
MELNEVPWDPSVSTKFIYVLYTLLHIAWRYNFIRNSPCARVLTWLVTWGRCGAFHLWCHGSDRWFNANDTKELWSHPSSPRTFLRVSSIYKFCTYGKFPAYGRELPTCLTLHRSCHAFSSDWTNTTHCCFLWCPCHSLVLTALTFLLIPWYYSSISICISCSLGRQTCGVYSTIHDSSSLNS